MTMILEPALQQATGLITATPAAPPPRARTVRRPGRAKAVVHGPPQVAIEDQAGLYMGREILNDFKRDPLGRDKFTVEERIREWEETEGLYHEHKDAPLPLDLAYLRIPAYGVHLMAGEMGEGKTLVAAWIGRHFRRRGWNVFSTAGFLFGQRLSLVEAYSFPEKVTPGAFIFVDEVHTYVDRFSSNSVRSRTFGQSSTAMRKEQITCLGASANSHMVGWEYRGATECVLVPRRWYPPRGRKLRAPPFCHLGLSKLFPFPYKRKDQLLLDAGLVRGNERLIARWRPAPTELMAAAMLMDSFESVTIGENFDLGAAAMKEERQGGGAPARAGGGEDGPGGGLRGLVGLIRQVHDGGLIRIDRGPVRFSTIRDILKNSGAGGISATMVRSALEMAGCDVGNNSVQGEELTGLFAYMAGADGE